MEQQHKEPSHRAAGQDVTLETLQSSVLELTEKVNLLLASSQMKNSSKGGGGLDEDKTTSYEEHGAVAEDDLDDMVMPKKRKRGELMSGSERPSSGTIVTPTTDPMETLEDDEDCGEPIINGSEHPPTDATVTHTIDPMETLEVDEDVLKKFTSFKKFDVVVDHSHHYFSEEPAPKKESKEWLETLKKDLRELEERLPEGIYVRVYESRMDLLSAVFIGPEDTPYQDGLFFFDMCFLRGYPKGAPLLRYHSFGLSIHPYLYTSGLVRLKFIKQSGDCLQWENMWVPGTSNILQLLVHLQKFFKKKPLLDDIIYRRILLRDEAAYNLLRDEAEYKRNLSFGEANSLKYNEETIVKCLQTMVYIMENPPKVFVDLVVGHFHVHASGILMRLSRLLNGLQEKGTCSQTFVNELNSCVKPLVAVLKKTGVPDTAFMKIQECSSFTS